MISFEWFTLSNAFEKSRSMRSVCFPWLVLRARSSMSDTNCVSQERLSLKEISCVSHTKNSFENNPLDSYISTGGLFLNMEWHGAIE